MSIKRITQQKLAEKYNVTQGFVSMAIRGERTSELAHIIKQDYAYYLHCYAANLAEEHSVAA